VHSRANKRTSARKNLGGRAGSTLMALARSWPWLAMMTVIQFFSICNNLLLRSTERVSRDLEERAQTLQGGNGEDKVCSKHRAISAPPTPSESAFAFSMLQPTLGAAAQAGARGQGCCTARFILDICLTHGIFNSYARHIPRLDLVYMSHIPGI
jgi:hypothetical protein